MVTELSIPSSTSTQSVYLASRYRQGDRTVYSLTLSPLELISILPRPNPDRKATLDASNRAIRKRHAEDFANYFRKNTEWVIPALILRAPNPLDFEMIADHDGTQIGALVVTRIQASSINILDGQHRTLGFFIASEKIASELDALRTSLAQAKRQDPDGAAEKSIRREIEVVEAQLARLSSERISVQLYIEADPQAYRQMFFDISDNALGITASVKARFDTRSVVNRALPAILEYPLFDGRTELESNMVGRQSENLYSAKQVVEIMRAVNVGFNGRFGKNIAAMFTETMIASRMTTFLNDISQVFPQFGAVERGQLAPSVLRKTSLLGSAAFVRILAGLYHELQDKAKHGQSREDVIAFFQKLAPHVSSDDLPVYPGSIWVDQMPDGVFPNWSAAPGGRRQDIQAVYDTMLGWAIDKPAFLDKPPAPRPKRNEELTDEEYALAQEELAELRERQAAE